jgi:hypothetical protein
MGRPLAGGPNIERRGRRSASFVCQRASKDSPGEQRVPLTGMKLSFLVPLPSEAGEPK